MRTLTQAGPPLIQSLKKFAGIEFAKGSIELDALGKLNNCLDEILAIIENPPSQTTEDSDESTVLSSR